MSADDVDSERARAASTPKADAIRALLARAEAVHASNEDGLSRIVCDADVAELCDAVRWLLDQRSLEFDTSMAFMADSDDVSRDLRALVTESAATCAGPRSGRHLWRVGGRTVHCLSLATQRVSWSDRATDVCDAHVDDAKWAAANDSSGDRTDDPCVEPIGQSDIVTKWWPDVIRHAEEIP